MITLTYRGGPRDGRYERMPHWLKNQAQPPKIISCRDEAVALNMWGVYRLGYSVYQNDRTTATYYWKPLTRKIA